MVGELQNLPKWRRLVLLLASFFGLAAGLCTVFALVVTGPAGRNTPGHSGRRRRRRFSDATWIFTLHKPESYWIDCSISYMVGGERIVSHVHSRSTPAPRRVIWQYPPGQFERLQEWVNAHPTGTPIAVHYDPVNQSEAVLVATDMPLGGPRTPGNLNLLEIAALSCVVMVAIARITRPRSAAVSGGG